MNPEHVSSILPRAVGQLAQKAGVTPVIVGIDADVRRVAYAVARGGIISTVATIRRESQHGHVHGEYANRIDKLFARCGEAGATVFIEGVFLYNGSAGNVLTFRRLCEVAGELRYVARLHNVRVETVQPSEWQSSVLGFTRDRDRLKQASADKARQVTGRDDLTEHECDAVCIALHGLAAVNSVEVAS